MTSAWKAAARAGDVGAMERLLTAGEHVDALDEHGQTALMVAATQGHAAAVSLLIRRGATLDHTAKYHLTALMLAVINGHAEIVRALVEAGADLSVRGTGAPGFHGKTALDLAEGAAHDAIGAPQRRDIAGILRAALGRGAA